MAAATGRQALSGAPNGLSTLPTLKETAKGPNGKSPEKGKRPQLTLRSLAAATPPETDKIDYEKILAIFTAPHTAELAEKRFSSAVERVARVNSGGVAIRDLPYIERMLNLVYAYTRKSGSSALDEPVCALIRSLALPFIKKSSTDEVKSLSNIASLLQTLAQVFVNGAAAGVQIEAAISLGAFASAQGARAMVAESSPRQFHTNTSILTSSGALRLAVEGLRTAAGPTGTDDLRVAILQSLVQGSYTVDGAAQIVAAGASEPVAEMLVGVSHKSPLAFYCLGLLWNLLERCPTASILPGAAAAKLPLALTELLGHLLLGGHRSQDKSLRNECIVLSKLFFAGGATRHENTVALVDAGMLRLLTAAATFPEAFPAQNDVIKPFNVSRDPLDFELRRLAWSALATLAEAEPDARPELGACGFLPVLLCYITTDAEASEVRRWLPDQRSQLQQDAIATVTYLAPVMPEAIAAAGGAGVLVRFAAAISAGGTATSLELSLTASHTTIGAVAHDEAKLLGSVAAAVAAAAQVESLAGPLGDVGAVELCLTWMSDGSRAPQLRETATRALSALSGRGRDANAQRLRKCGGVAVIVAELQSMCNIDQSLDPSVQVAVTVALVKNALLPHRKSAARFLSDEGLEALLDLLEICHVALRPAVLSCLADVVASPLARPFFAAWRGHGAPANAAAAGSGARKVPGHPATLRSTASFAPSLARTSVVLAHSAGAAGGPGSSLPSGARPDSGLGEAGAHGRYPPPPPLGVPAYVLILRLWRAEERSNGLLTPEGVLASRYSPYAMPRSGAAEVAATANLARSKRRPFTPPGTLSGRAAPDATIRYGTLLPTRRAGMSRLGAAINPDALFSAAYAVLKEVGFESFEAGLELEDQATLAGVKRYPLFREGEAWAEVSDALAAEGTIPVEDDVKRIEEAIAASVAAADEVISIQRGLLEEAKKAHSKSEAAFYLAKSAQEQLERDSRVYQKDLSKLTMREQAAARQKMATMVAHSLVRADALGLFGEMNFTTDISFDDPGREPTAPPPGQAAAAPGLPDDSALAGIPSPEEAAQAARPPAVTVSDGRPAPPRDHRSSISFGAGVDPADGAQQAEAQHQAEAAAAAEQQPRQRARTPPRAAGALAEEDEDEDSGMDLPEGMPLANESSVGGMEDDALELSAEGANGEASDEAFAFVQQALAAGASVTDVGVLGSQRHMAAEDHHASPEADDLDDEPSFRALGA